MNIKKVIFILIGVLILISGVAVGIYLVGKNQDMREKAAPSTNVSIYPSTQTKARGDDVNFNVVMDTGSNQITTLDLVLSFDPQALQITSITKGVGIVDFTSELKNSFDNVGGKIYYSNFAVDKTKAVTGTGLTILTITGKVKDNAASGSYQMAFLPQTTVAGLTEGVNVLVAKTQGTLIVSGVQATSTPSPTPNPTATPVPGSAPTSTPVPVPTTRPLPVSGASTPTFLFAGLGAFLIIIPLVFFIL